MFSCISDMTDGNGELAPEPVKLYDTLAAAPEMRAELERLRDVVCEEEYSTEHWPRAGPKQDIESVRRVKPLNRLSANVVDCVIWPQCAPHPSSRCRWESEQNARYMASNPHSLLAHTARLRLCWPVVLVFIDYAGHCARRVKGCPPVPVRAGAPASYGDHEQEATLTHTEQDLAVQCPLCNAPVGFRCCNIKLPNAERREPHRRRMYIGAIHAKQEVDNGLQEFC